MIFRAIDFEDYTPYQNEKKRREAQFDHFQLNLFDLLGKEKELNKPSDHLEQLNLFDWLTEEYINFV